MKLMEQEKRDKLMQLPEVVATTNPVLVVYVKEVTEELNQKVSAIMDGIAYVLIKKE
jgi:hypothetical protein